MNKIVVFCGSSLGFNPIYKEAAISLGNYFAENKIGLSLWWRKNWNDGRIARLQF